MKRLLAGIVVIAVVGVAIATHGSSAASPRRAQGGSPVVSVTPKLKRLLQLEISTLRATQPTAPRALPGHRRLLTPDRGVPCFIAGSSRCSVFPCQGFASAPAVVFKTSSTEMIRRPGARRQVVAPAPGA
ncbi:MAG: hypothetical protein M3065_10545, partial [Actinomycetota bacterium]|nr:hypothetical protein [Actinomycetota bacterium]